MIAASCVGIRPRRTTASECGVLPMRQSVRAPTIPAKVKRATIVTVGSRANSRAGLGSVATAMLHDAPCSVLIAHTEFAGDEDVVVGFDGSGAARRPLAVGRELAERLSLKLRVLVATGDAHPPGPGWSRAAWAGYRAHRGSAHADRSTRGCILVGPDW
jgi:nucleotide-binding universal stress UspA family protein